MTAGVDQPPLEPRDRAATPLDDALEDAAAADRCHPFELGGEALDVHGTEDHRAHVEGERPSLQPLVTRPLRMLRREPCLAPGRSRVAAHPVDAVPEHVRSREAVLIAGRSELG